MGVFLTVVSLTYLSIGLGALPEESKYTTKYDNIDLEEIIKNDRLMMSYIDCLLDKRICTPDGLELKKNMSDAIKTDCSKCSEKQKEGSDFIMNFLIDNKPEYWTKLEEKYDPSGSYKRKYLELRNSEVRAEPLVSF